MSPIRLRRTLPVFTLLTALLVTPTLAQALPSQPNRPAATESAGFLGSLWHLLTSLWGAEGGSIDPWGGHSQPTNGARSSGALHNLWGATGMSIDPNGGSGNPSSGGSIDPNGGGASPTGGGSIDPWGI
jgi:hypothetical protein